MITGIGIKHKSLSQQNNWQHLLAQAIRDPEILMDYLELPKKNLAASYQAHKKHKLLVPLSYADKIKKGCWDDPLLKQILPIEDETFDINGYVSDPVGDLEASLSPGVLQKYQGRALIVTTGTCAVHCRYCFRQEFPYSESNPAKNNWQQTIDVIANDTSIHEVILSGGDPFILSDERLFLLCQQLAILPHIKILRFHTRIPIVLPQRIDDNFLAWFSSLAIKKVVVIHANHANEIDPIVGDTLCTLANAGSVLLNQSVLLKGVNDSVEALEDLSQQLFHYQTLPYYLHLLDKVSGTAHFDIEQQQALIIMAQLRNRLPGYLVPKLVREISGKRSKTPIV
ncbi:MAG: EF-P beta-lysylation protein EpmB [Cocleimonas sp.]|nr:EF-P beta-lysylation protein EpmB [Cocleimonas sp.]